MDILTPGHTLLDMLTEAEVKAIRTIGDGAKTWRGKAGHDTLIQLAMKGLVRMRPIDSSSADVFLTDLGKQVRDAAG